MEKSIMKTAGDLVAWLRGRREELSLDDDDLELFVKTKIHPSDIYGKSVEDITRLLVAWANVGAVRCVRGIEAQADSSQVA
jgi:hypothetical protein